MTIQIREKIFVLFSTLLFLFDYNQFSFTGFNVDEKTCWPHFPQCRDFSLTAVPESYTSNVFFMFLFAGILACLYYIWKNRPEVYLKIFASLVGLKVFIYFFWTFTEHHNFAYFHLMPATAFLLNKKNRIFAAQVTWALAYSLSAAVKLDDSWILGTYFTPLELGMPFVPRELIPLGSLFVIFLEIIVSWTLLSDRLKQASTWIWTGFHTYSVILVGFFYPTRCIASLWTLFLGQSPQENPAPKVLNKKTFLFLFLMTGLQVIPYTFAEEPRMIMRWEGYGFNMFDANFQCLIEYKYGNQREVIIRKSSMHRCSPRKYLDLAKMRCAREKKPVSYRMIKSINGEPFYEIVKLENACREDFLMFGENSWLDHRNPKLVGYPYYNNVRSENPSNELEFVSPVPVVQKVKLQEWLFPYRLGLKVFLLMLWSASIVFVLWRYLKSLRS